MQIKTDGFVISEKSISDNTRLLTLITRNNGVIRAFSKGSKSSKNRNFAACQTFSYSDFIIFKSRNTYTINEANLKFSFFEIIKDIEKLALAQYFCEVILAMVAENFESENILRLLLNSIYCLKSDKTNPKIIKSVFEMRILSMIGYMPNLLECSCCSNFKPSKMFFCFEKNSLICDKCISGNFTKLELSDSLLKALRYSIFADFSKMFSFEINSINLKKLNKITESCLMNYIDKPLYSLDFYKKTIIKTNKKDEEK